MVGEGGNLGFTQKGRIEYALRGGPDDKGGRVNTDAIDNAAGVNCSDHEVNIKILLDGLVADGDMTFKQRNELLAEMTDAVADQVLYGSYTQTQAISLAMAQAASMVDVHARLIRHLEQNAGLNRQIEFLPSDDTIDERKAAHRAWSRPSWAWSWPTRRSISTSSCSSPTCPRTPSSPTTSSATSRHRCLSASATR